VRTALLRRVFDLASSSCDEKRHDRSIVSKIVLQIFYLQIMWYVEVFQNLGRRKRVEHKTRHGRRGCRFASYHGRFVLFFFQKKKMHNRQLTN